MSIEVRGFTRRCVDVWSQTDSSPETLPAEPRYTAEDQSAREGHLERLLHVLSEVGRDPPRTEGERRASEERLLSAFETFAESALGFNEQQINALHLRDMSRLSTQFTSAARRFDPEVSDGDLFQALRNAWTMAYIELLIGTPVRLTPAIFAYSMLYPYSDNYLDDPSVDEGDKTLFVERLGLRLAGGEVAAPNAFERAIFHLVSMIEVHYDRAEHPEVYESLLAIHDAQKKSTDLLRRDAALGEVDVLGIGFQKGGCSVLADGYLVAGHLTKAQAESLFRLGTVLQLVDDLQDVHDDVRDGLMTAFSRAAAGCSSQDTRLPHGTGDLCPIDDIATRTMWYAAAVAQDMTCFHSADSTQIREVLRGSVALMLILAISRVSEYFSEAYIEKVETQSPFRFSFLSDCSRRYAEQGVTRPGLARTFASFCGPRTKVPADVELLLKRRGQPSPARVRRTPRGR